MYLSKLLINTTSREFRRDYANIHDMHRTIMSAFPTIDDTSARQAHAVLWRLDNNQHGFTQYVQSITQPNWSHLPPGYLHEPAHTRSLQPVIDAIQPGRRFAFRILANPTRTLGRRLLEHTTTNPTKKRSPGTTTAIRKPAEQIAWLARQAQRHGFVIPTSPNGQPDTTPSPCPTLTGRRNDSPTTTITIEPVRFDGHLIITDPDTFTTAIHHGIGRAKAYGCGLITLAPA
jgi:CRISPR system Cascade subunit CasE